MLDPTRPTSPLNAPHPGPVVIWTTGRNIAGYLPESDPTYHGTREEAASALAEEMREYADRDDEITWETLPSDEETARANGYAVTDDGIDYGDDVPAMRATVDSILADDGPDRPGEDSAARDWDAWIEDGRGRRIVFWLHGEPLTRHAEHATPFVGCPHGACRGVTLEEGLELPEPWTL